MAQADKLVGSPSPSRAVHQQSGALSVIAGPTVVLSDVLDRLTEVCYVTTTCGFATVMLVGVFFRYALNNSLAWSDEVSLILFIWATLFAATTAYRHDKHVNIDFLVRALPPAWQARAAVLAQSLTGAYIVCLLVSSQQAVAIVARGRTDVLLLPDIVEFVPIPLACVVMLVHWLRRNVVATTWLSLAVKLLLIAGFFWAVYLPLGQVIELGGLPRFLLLFVAFALPLLLGAPVAFALGLAATLYLAVYATVPFGTGAAQVFHGIRIYALLAVPLLVLAGTLMHAAGIAERIVDFAQVLVGRVRGGLGAANVVASFLFGDISGSAVSDTAAIGSLMIPEMKLRGYRADFCAALQGAAGTLGMTAPLSITLILFATAIEASVSRLAAATIVPGFLVAASFMVVTLLHARRHDYPREYVPRSEYLARVLGAVPGLFALVLILGGILGGVFTPAEVGTVLLFYVLMLAFVLYRRVGPRQLYRTIVVAGHISGMTLFMTATSAFLGFMLTTDLVAFLLVDTISQVTTNKYVVLFLANLVFVVLGMVLEAPPIIFGFMPTFMPLLLHVGVDPIHWGVLFVINMGLGMLVPPVALNLFISTAIAGVRYNDAVRAAVPFMLIIVVDMVIIALFPHIPLWLPHVLFGHPIR
ncbi:MAG: TRAP transporter large permease subunit [Chloroflexi bacterium]|nr:TRAP transporter large permease subunit [Chloroflexota bacterium]